MSDLKLHFIHPDMACGTYGNALIVSLLGPTTAKSMLESGRVGRLLSDDNRKKICSVTVVDRSARVPDGEVRRLTADTLRESNARTQVMAILMEGEGMWTSAARAVLAGLMLMSSSKAPSHVVANAREVAEKVKASFVGDFSGLEEAVLMVRDAHRASAR